MDASRLPIRSSAVWPTAVLVATALAFLPMQALPSFDVPKLVVLLFGAAAAVAFVAVRRAGPQRDDVTADPILALPLLLTLVAVVGALTAWPRGSLVGPVTALGCVALARLAAQSADPRGAVRAFARGVATAAAVAGVYAVAQKLGFDFTPWRDRRQVVATFGNTSFAAEFQAAALPLSTFLLLHGGSSPRDRALGAAAALLGVVHLALASSRIDFVAAGAALGVAACLVLVGDGKPRVAKFLALGGAAAAAALAIAFFAAARGDGTSWLGRSDTVAVRVGVWESTARMIADAPMRVAGAPFVDLFPSWRDADEYRISLGRRVETPHDDYLEIAVALGVPGLLAALAVVALLARRIVAAAREHVAECAALGGSLAAVAVSALASSPLSHPATALLPALAAGLVVAIAPRPWRGAVAPARAVDVAFAVALALAVWPGPAWKSLRSDGFLALGRVELAEGGDARRALVLLDRAAQVDPQAFDARFELGAVLASAKQHDKAIETLTSAMDLRPGDFECRVNLAYALRDAGRADDARRVVDESLARCPWHPTSLAARAVFALADGRAADALVDAKRAEAGLPSDPRLVALAAEARLAAEPSEDAYAGALDALVALFERGETVELGRFARSMLRRDRGLAGPLVTRARRLAATKPDVAAALVLAGVSGVKDDAGFLDDAAIVLRQTGRADESKVVLGRALGVRAVEAFERGEDQKAIKLAGQAAERDPRPAHHLVAARAAARLGEREAALEEVGAAVASGTVHPDEIRHCPVLSKLLPDPRLDDLIDRAARRSGENHGKPAPR